MENTFQPLGVGVGTLINSRYELVHKLGSGAMSAVYQVADRALNNDTIALKLFAPGINNDPTLIERIRNEVLITRKLTAENIVRTYDFGQTKEGLYFMTMEYIEGVTLDRLIYSNTGRRPAFSDVVRILRDVARGISYAHSHGVIHRDLKPANIIVSQAGEVKIADFGLARAMNISHDLTRVGECVGTPFYMSPEQIQGQEVDARSDIYSLGIIAYEMVAGKTPFYDQSWFNLAQQIISSPLPELNKACGAPAWFFTFVAKAAGKRPEHRFETADDVVRFLNEKLEAGDVLEVLPTDARLPKVISSFSKSLAPRAVKAKARFSIGPTQLLMGALVLFLFALLVSLTRSNSNVQNNIQQGAETVNRMADTMDKMTRFVDFVVKNQDKIESLSAGVENQVNSPAPEGGAPDAQPAINEPQTPGESK